jgi:flagellar motor switch protein FliN/FliY
MAKNGKTAVENPTRKQQEDHQKQTAPQQTPAPEAAPQQTKKQVQAVDLPEAVETQTQPPTGKLDILLDMDVPVTVTFGQTQIPVRRLLQLGPGSVLRLSKPVETPVDLYLKDSKFAEADVVVVDNQFALRIRQIIGTGTEVNPRQQ